MVGRALDVGDEGVQAFGKVHVHASAQPAMLHQHPLHHVRQWQVGEHAVVLTHGHPAQAGHEGPGEVAEGVHHALGRARGARGVDQGGQFISAPHGHACHGVVVHHDLVPTLVRGLHVIGAERIAEAGHASRHARLHAFPAVELANEAGLGFAVFQDLLNGAGRQGRVERHGNVARHPNGQVGHQPPSAVLGEQRHFAAFRPALRLEEGGHAPRLIGNLAPSEGFDLPVAHGLGQGNPAGLCGFPVVQALQSEVVGGNWSAHGVLAAKLAGTVTVIALDALRPRGLPGKPLE